MGNYTELIFGASFKKDTPTEVIETIRYLAGDLVTLPEVLLWENRRNPLMGGSMYFAVSASVTSMYYCGVKMMWTLSSRANIKNYDDEIEEFLELVRPYIEDGSGERDLYAIVINEYDKIPTMYYLRGDQE